MKRTVKSKRRKAAWRSSIPKDMYDRVFDPSLAIVNATYREDRREIRDTYGELEDYYRQQEAAGRPHPFLPETVADFTNAKSKAIKLYHAALRLSRRMGEQKHTIQLSLGRLYLEAGNRRAARRWLLAARRDARRYKDADDAAEAARLLREASGQPNPRLERTGRRTARRGWAARAAGRSTAGR